MSDSRDEEYSELTTMDCDDARRYWDLYYDSEGDGGLYLEINSHLEHCHPCAEWFCRQSRLEDAITARLASREPSAELWDRVLAQTILQPSRFRTAWFLGGGLLALAASLLVAVGLWQHRQPASPDLAALTADYHGELAAAAKVPEFRSPSDLEVENYLRRRVNFPVRCPPRRDSGFAVEGAGISRLAGEEAAYVVGSVEGIPVSLFILPRDSLSRFAHQYDAVEREGIHWCREGAYAMAMTTFDQNVVLVIGQTGRDRLRRILDAYGSYPHSHPEQSQNRSAGKTRGDFV